MTQNVKKVLLVAAFAFIGTTASPLNMDTIKKNQKTTAVGLVALVAGVVSAVARAKAAALIKRQKSSQLTRSAQMLTQQKIENLKFVSDLTGAVAVAAAAGCVYGTIHNVLKNGEWARKLHDSKEPHISDKTGQKSENINLFQKVALHFFHAAELTASASAAEGPQAHKAPSGAATGAAGAATGAAGDADGDATGAGDADGKRPEEVAV